MLSAEKKLIKEAKKREKKEAKRSRLEVCELSHSQHVLLDSLMDSLSDCPTNEKEVAELHKLAKKQKKLHTN